LHRRTILIGLIAALVSAGSVLAAHGPLTVPAGGNFVDASGGTGTFAGQFALVEFANENSQLVARGFVSGILTDSHGKVLGSAFKDVSVPVVASNEAASAGGHTASLSVVATATCPILHLDLGPLSLNLLGLQVNLSEVVLDISAQSGPGNLLGNLLCAVTNLLNGTSTSALANLLNQILQVITNVLG